VTFTVSWLESAEQELAQLWLDADQRERFTLAANEIDRLLRLHPEEVGESREKGRRIQLVRPLGAMYRVSIDDRLVRVVHVWEY
jgi:hypothetical protein